MAKDIFNGNPLYTDEDSQRAFKQKSDLEYSYRTPYRKDYGRLIHSAAFRRLQGKTQLFPSSESDFFRNRLTHSLEVAQIAKSIAIKLNAEFLPKDKQIDLDIVEIAGLAHDLGHPPFGHNGELALDECMREKWGGFEGNAQTLRILARLEKKETYTRSTENKHEPVKKSNDNRCGLNLTARTLASILKYDYEIPLEAEKRISAFKERAPKGFYASEAKLVNQIKKYVIAGKTVPSDLKFKTIECQIMDIADDIAYSTYDIEDAFKAKFLNPLALVSAKESFYHELAAKIKRALDNQYSDHSETERQFTNNHAILLIERVFRDIFDIYGDKGPPKNPEEIVPFQIAGQISYSSELVAGSGYYRTQLTSQLVGEFIEGIEFNPNSEFPALSEVRLNIEIFKRVELLKHFSHLALIESPMLKLAEFRGKDIIHALFDTLTDDTREGYMLLPNDFRELYTLFDGNEAEQKRVICDFIAGMTDRYSMEFYNRICGTSPETIHKPL